MPLHLHTMRYYCGTAVVIIPAVALLGGAYSSPADAPDLARVTGRATCGDHPLGGMRIMFLEDGPRGFTASGLVEADGSFRMKPWSRLDREGVAPGTYRVYFIPKRSGAPDPWLDPKYQDPGMSGLLVRVGPDWNEIVFSLPGPDRGPTVVRHRRVRPLQIGDMVPHHESF
jgi:hypothetical protein